METQNIIMENLKTIKEDSMSGLSKPWQKFFNKFNEINDLKVSQWKEVHVLGHFSKRFEDTLKRKYVVPIKGAPSKSPDIFMVKKLYASLGTSDPRIIKEYIDWVFDYIIIPQKLNPRKISFLLNVDFLNDFVVYKNSPKIIKRTSELPKEYKDLANSFNIDVSTYEDLAFIKLSLDKGMDRTGNYKLLLGNIEALGFNLNDLMELK